MWMKTPWVAVQQRLSKEINNYDGERLGIIITKLVVHMLQTFPVRISKRIAPRLHQSAPGVASDSPSSSVHKRQDEKKKRASPGIEPGTSRTLSENHASRPTGQNCDKGFPLGYTILEQPTRRHVECPQQFVVVALFHVIPLAEVRKYSLA